MAINEKPYKVGDKNFVDKDPDSKLNYVANATKFLTDSGTTAKSFTVKTTGSIVLLFKSDPQGDRGGLLPARFTGAPGTAVFHLVTDDDQEEDFTINFNAVEK